jgi:hypothetical protein
MKGQASENFSERRLEKAYKHVSSLWFPINPNHLAMIRDNFNKGSYDNDPDRLFHDLKHDFALFTYIVKELMPLAAQERIEPRIIHNPAALIKWAGPNKIAQFVVGESRLPLSHLFHALTPFQAERLRETAIIASTAELLSEQSNLDPDTGFSRGLIREIGLNLIAWNYPTVFSRVIKSLTSAKTLDEELSQELGFSPFTLAMRVLRPDQLPSTPLQDDFNAEWASYDQLCEIGEALARAENPDTYPSAENDWKTANAYLQKTVGSSGVELIKSKAIECSREYKRSLNTLFKSLKEFNPDLNVQRYQKRATARRNRYISQCPPEVQVALQELYSRIAEAASRRDILEALLRKIIPEAGFTGGCVFVVDPTEFALLPRTVFGNVKLRSVERVALKSRYADSMAGVFPGSMSITGSEPDLAASALSCAQPVIERHDEDDCSGLTGMYGSLGDTKKMGVLYLEAPEAIDSAQDQQAIITFKAMRQALSDALHLD